MSTRRIELMELSKIKPADANPKDHDVGAILASFEKFGFGEAPMLDERTGKLVAGHGRTETLVALKKDGKSPPTGVELSADGEWMIPVQRGWKSKNDAQAKGYLLASNRTAELGGWDKGELDAMLLELAKQDGPEALVGTGFDGDDLDRMLLDGRNKDPEDDVPDVPKKPWVKLGQQFRLGDHLLDCGDSAEPWPFDELAAAMWTDPPTASSTKARLAPSRTTTQRACLSF